MNAKKIRKPAILVFLLLAGICAVLLVSALRADSTQFQDYMIFQQGGVQTADKEQQMLQQLESRLTETVNAVDGVADTKIQIGGGQEQRTVKAELKLRSGYVLSDEQRAGIEALLQNSTGIETVEIQIV